MSSFTSSLIVSPLPDGRRWVLRRAFSYHVGSEASTTVITPPAGFVMDFASVPRPVWWLLPPWGKYGNAAVIHDWLYASHLFARAQADAIFLEAMGVLGVSKWKRWTMYAAVRLGGGWAYRKGGKPEMMAVDGDETLAIGKISEIDKFERVAA